MIRLIIVAITVIGFLILSIPILFIEWIIVAARCASSFFPEREIQTLL